MINEEIVNNSKTYATRIFDSIKDATTKNKKSFLIGAGVGALLFSPLPMLTAAAVGGAVICASALLLDNDKRKLGKKEDPFVINL